MYSLMQALSPPSTSVPDKDSKNFRLQVYSDGQTIPDIDLPLQAFFGETDQINFSQSLLVSTRGNSDGTVSFISNLPMPYNNGLRFVVSNTGKNKSTLCTRFGVTKETSNMRMKVAYRYNEVLEKDADPEILELYGKGRLVLLTIAGKDLGPHPYNKLAFLEGNTEYIVDDNQPIIQTGTEDQVDHFYWKDFEHLFLLASSLMISLTLSI
jgi:hypothetical protein